MWVYSLTHEEEDERLNELVKAEIRKLMAEAKTIKRNTHDI